MNSQLPSLTFKALPPAEGFVIIKTLEYREESQNCPWCGGYGFLLKASGEKLKCKNCKDGYISSDSRRDKYIIQAGNLREIRINKDGVEYEVYSPLKIDNRQRYHKDIHTYSEDYFDIDPDNLKGKMLELNSHETWRK